MVDARLAEKRLHDIRRLVEKMESDGSYDTQMGPVVRRIHLAEERAAYKAVQSINPDF